MVWACIEEDVGLELRSSPLRIAFVLCLHLVTHLAASGSGGDGGGGTGDRSGGDRGG
jgi:hypothetical protein